MNGPTTKLILNHLREGGSIVVHRGQTYFRLSNGCRGADIHPLSLAPLLQQDLLKARRPIKGRTVYTLNEENDGTNP